MTLEEQGNEWLRRLRLPHVEVHRDFGKRYSSISLKLLGNRGYNSSRSIGRVEVHQCNNCTALKVVEHPKEVVEGVHES